jgi:hypothetical protein
MKQRLSAWTTPLVFALAITLFVTPAAGQSRPGSPKKWTAPFTPDGQPDLQGIW